MILVTTYYNTLNEDRNNEINKCLCKNYENKYIEKIYLLNNKEYDLNFLPINNRKVIQHIISNDDNYILKYNDAINFINKNLKNKICILSNSDIYFDNSISKINHRNINNHCFALLRYDEDENDNSIKKIFTRFNEPRDDSQDCWIFKSPLNIDLNIINFSFGTLGCDSILATNIYESGLKISNPSLDIVTTHLHKIDYRTYNCDHRIHGKYCLLKPCYLNEYPEPKFMDY
jgi:hypothetical protein